jgi:hypothetical protein
MKRLLYVLGAGAQWACLTALEGYDRKVFESAPFPHEKYPNGVALGWIGRPPDNRGRGFQAIALDWLKRADPENVLVTGHDLANETFFEEALRQGFDLTVAYTAAPFPPAAEEVRVYNLAQRSVEPAWWLDLSEPISVVAARLRLHPVLAALRRPCARCEGACGPRKRASTSRVRDVV